MDIEELALLRAIDATPEDDLPRLVYADWLEERGQAIRAEFIRLQCEIAKLEVGPREIVDANYRLWKRQQELLDQNYFQLMGPIAYQFDSARVEFRRGFVNEVDTLVEDFCDHAVMLAGLLPRPIIRVSGVIIALQSFLTNPNLSIVHTLSALDPRRTLPYDELAILQDSSLYTILMDALPQLTNLRELYLSSCGLGDYGLGILELGSFPKLNTLDLSFNQITDAGVVSLLNMGLLQRLEVILMSGNPISDQGAIELADRLGRSDKLRHLNLRMTRIERAGQQALLRRFGSKVDLF